VWLEENIILLKDVQKWVDKNLKNPMKTRVFIIYQRTKVQKLGSLKNESGLKNLVNYIKWKP
jgi:hypothetical protein